MTTQGGAAPDPPAPSAPAQAEASPRLDLLVAAVLLAFGVAIVVLSLGMPTFAEQSGSGLTAPGIVPGFHGAVIALLAIALGLRAMRRGALSAGVRRTGGQDARSLVSAAGLGIAYAAVLVGRLPFWLATAMFVFAFIAAFEWPQARGRRLRRLAEAAALGLATGIVITLVFEDLFLVRLP